MVAEECKMKKQVFWYRVGARTAMIEMAILLASAAPTLIGIAGAIQSQQAASVSIVSSVVQSRANTTALPVPWLVVALLGLIFLVGVTSWLPEDRLTKWVALNLASGKLRHEERKKKTAEKVAEIERAVAEKGFTLEE